MHLEPALFLAVANRAKIRTLPTRKIADSVTVSRKTVFDLTFKIDHPFDYGRRKVAGRGIFHA